jgi:hypothetical protein
LPVAAWSLQAVSPGAPCSTARGRRPEPLRSSNASFLRCDGDRQMELLLCKVAALRSSLCGKACANGLRSPGRGSWQGSLKLRGLFTGPRGRDGPPRAPSASFRGQVWLPRRLSRCLPQALGVPSLRTHFLSKLDAEPTPIAWDRAKGSNPASPENPARSAPSAAVGGD